MKAAEEVFRERFKNFHGCFLARCGVCSSYIETVADLIHVQAQGLVKEMLERVPEKEVDMKNPNGSSDWEKCGFNEARSALLEWAKSKNLV